MELRMFAKASQTTNSNIVPHRIVLTQTVICAFITYIYISIDTVGLYNLSYLSHLSFRASVINVLKTLYNYIWLLYE